MVKCYQPNEQGPIVSVGKILLLVISGELIYYNKFFLKKVLITYII
jgi:hypothetical protein